MLVRTAATLASPEDISIHPESSTPRQTPRPSLRSIVAVRPAGWNGADAPRVPAVAERGEASLQRINLRVRSEKTTCVLPNSSTCEPRTLEGLKFLILPFRRVSPSAAPCAPHPRHRDGLLTEQSLVRLHSSYRDSLTCEPKAPALSVALGPSVRLHARLIGSLAKDYPPNRVR